MENLTLDKLRVLEDIRKVRTRCGLKAIRISLTGDNEFPICAVVLEEVVKGRGRRKKTHIENNLVLYHADGRLYEDKDDDFDLVITE